MTFKSNYTADTVDFSTQSVEFPTIDEKSPSKSNDLEETTDLSSNYIKIIKTRIRFIKESIKVIEDAFNNLNDSCDEDND